jgi:hypothetical protein
MDRKWIAIGIGLGTTVGVATHNLAIGVALGTAFGPSHGALSSTGLRG